MAARYFAKHNPNYFFLMNLITKDKATFSRSITSFIVLSVILSGCGLLESDNDEPLQLLESPEVELIPLAVGNYWVYDMWYNEPTWRDTIRNEVFSMHNVIVENTKVRAYGTYLFSLNTPPEEDTLISLSANGSEGYYVIGFEAPLDSLNKLAEGGLRYKYPANPGDAWEHTTIVYNVIEQKLRIGETRTVTLVDTTKTVETEADIFENCFVYIFQDFRIATLLYHHIYIKPKVGIIGVDTFEADNPNDTSSLYGQQRLLEYDLNISP